MGCATCSEGIYKPEAPIALRAQAVLLKGIVLIQEKKTLYAARETEDLRTKIINFDTKTEVTTAKSKQQTR